VAASRVSRVPVDARAWMIPQTTATQLMDELIVAAYVWQISRGVGHVMMHFEGVKGKAQGRGVGNAPSTCLSL
jgi:hypothetical protein